MPPLLCIVGKSNTGKTTLLEKLIPELTRRGYKVGTIKHDVHGFDMDRPGKDSWRHTQAGASAVAVSSPTRLALLQQVEREKTIEEIAELMGDSVDIILAEGFKRSSQLKVEISRSAVSRELLCSEDELVAVVSDVQHPVRVPQFGLDDMKGLGDLIENSYLKNPQREPVRMWVDGRRIPMKSFVRDIFDGAVRGMVASLQGTEGAKKITLKLEPEDEGEGGQEAER